MSTYLVVRVLIADTQIDQIGIYKCWFLRRGENWSTCRKTSQSKDENQQQTQPTYDAESKNQTRATLVGGECSHHGAIPAPHVYVDYCVCNVQSLFTSLQLCFVFRYFVLLMLTDGIISDMAQTKEAIVTVR